MKAKEISLTLTRNLGNYENAKMTVTYEMNEDDDVVDSFKSAQMEINEAFDALFPDYYDFRQYIEKSDIDESNVSESDVNEELTKRELTKDSLDFKNIVKRLKSGTITIDDIEKYYYFSDEIREMLEEYLKNA